MCGTSGEKYVFFLKENNYFRLLCRAKGANNHSIVHNETGKLDNLVVSVVDLFSHLK